MRIWSYWQLLQFFSHLQSLSDTSTHAFIPVTFLTFFIIYYPVMINWRRQVHPAASNGSHQLITVSVWRINVWSSRWWQYHWWTERTLHLVSSAVARPPLRHTAVPNQRPANKNWRTSRKSPSILVMWNSKTRIVPVQ